MVCCWDACSMMHALLVFIMVVVIIDGDSIVM